jgi:ParB-like chromosome segregation protein Spo0J
MSTEIAIEAIAPHPRNSNVMTEEALGKLQRHIDRTGRYEPLVVRPLGGEAGGAAQYQVLNGHHRLEVLRRLGRKTARCEVWEVDEREALLLLATLNRLEGRDDPMRRAALVAELAARSPGEDVVALARFLPEDRAALERALALGREALPRPVAAEAARAGALRPMTFFLRAEEMEVVRRALGAARASKEKEGKEAAKSPERGRGRAENLVRLAEAYLANARSDEPTVAQVTAVASDGE